MIKEPKTIDFYTSGRQLSSEDFALISQWIATDKKKQSDKNIKGLKKRQKKIAQTEGIEKE
ncbi:hypothetical protein GO755_35495 [Spirosoma sp. HMF4905]|uniref:Uncharacterized protein n=1 Tax=Spirosoma arboris TaxID=2682092 RepID=A0A7K1SNM2_9BACT|nr:hypothetical protein [Spirosoma arboris]MVM35381.1 hypothetical protein [Spirosoma arboris]